MQYDLNEYNVLFTNIEINRTKVNTISACVVKVELRNRNAWWGFYENYNIRLGKTVTYLQSLRKFLVARGHKSVNRSMTMSPTLVLTITAISLSLKLQEVASSETKFGSVIHQAPEPNRILYKSSFSFSNTPSQSFTGQALTSLRQKHNANDLSIRIQSPLFTFYYIPPQELYGPSAMCPP